MNVKKLFASSCLRADTNKLWSYSASVVTSDQICFQRVAGCALVDDLASRRRDGVHSPLPVFMGHLVPPFFPHLMHVFHVCKAGTLAFE